MLIAQKPNCRGRGKGVCCSVSAHSGGGVGWGGEVGGSVQWMKTTQHVLYVAAAKAVVRTVGMGCGGRGESLRVFADIRTRRSVTWIRDPSSVLS